MLVISLCNATTELSIENSNCLFIGFNELSNTSVIVVPDDELTDFNSFETEPAPTEKRSKP